MSNVFLTRDKFQKKGKKKEREKITIILRLLHIMEHNFYPSARCIRGVCIFLNDARSMNIQLFQALG